MRSKSVMLMARIWFCVFSSSSLYYFNCPWVICSLACSSFDWEQLRLTYCILVIFEHVHNNKKSNHPQCVLLLLSGKKENCYEFRMEWAHFNKMYTLIHSHKESSTNRDSISNWNALNIATITIKMNLFGCKIEIGRRYTEKEERNQQQ